MHLTSLTSTLAHLWRIVRRTLRRLWRVVWRLIALIALIVVLGSGTIHDTSLRARVTALARPHLFDYVAWEADALWGKAQEMLFGIQPYLEADEQRVQVVAFLERLSAAQDLDAQIERIYADPAVDDPASAAAALVAERDALRRELAHDQPLAESILEAQVSAVLVDEGFSWLGQVMPPVSMHITEVPTTLIVSPRDRIEYAVDLTLTPLTVEQREALEATIDTTLDVSSLVAPLGGLSLYPSMIVEPSSRDLPRKLARAIEVTAHEWAHHYLVFFPLGWEYSARPETRIINETTATFFGRAVAQRVMARFYPDMAQPVYPSFLESSPDSPGTPEVPPAPLTDPDAPEPFDFAREMNATRVRVDFLLWQGNVAAAETYMDARRREFARHGYLIRKLNQAYFAFYGGYQGSPGAGGSDPTGPAIETLLRDSRDLHGFLHALRDITTRDQLLAAQ